MKEGLIEAYRALENKQKRVEELLHSILPRKIVEQLHERRGEMVVERFDEVTVLFADVVGFTELSASIKPDLLILTLNRIFSAFDAVVENIASKRLRLLATATWRQPVFHRLLTIPLW